MEFSLFYFSTADQEAGGDKYRLLIDGARFADQHGFAAVWTPERHFHEFGGLYPNPCITSAALATVTERVRLRAGSTVLLLHDPVRFAENWSMVDNLSGGRVDVAIAMGWNSNDFYFAPESFERRAELLPGSLDRVLRLWRGETLDGVGGKGEPVKVRLFPRPVQPALPLWLPASGNPETFREAGRLGVNVLTYLEGQTLDELAAKIALYRRTRREHGHAGEGHVSLMLHTLVGPDREGALAAARPLLREYLRSSFFQRSQLSASLGMDLTANTSPADLAPILDRAVERYLTDRALVGDVESCVAMIERLRATGADEVACLVDFGLEPGQAMDGLVWLDRLRRRCQGDAGEPESLPLSEGQQELWAFLQTGPEATLAYNESVMLALRGPLDVRAAEAAAGSLAARHQALRLIAPDGRRQHLAQPRTDVRLTDLSALGGTALAAETETWLDREARRPFDLERGPLFRLALLRHAGDEHLLLLTAHHLIANGWSLGVLLEELAALYSAGGAKALPPLSPAVPFSSYLLWREERAAVRATHGAWWREKLATPWQAVELPADVPPAPPGRPGALSGARRTVRIEGELFEALRRLARDHGVTLFMAVLAAFEALLARLTGQDRIVVGVPVSEQAAMGAVRLVGHCTTMLPLCLEVPEEESFARLLARVRTALGEAFDHQDVSWTALAAEGGSFAMPPIDVLFNMDRAPGLPAFAGLEVSLAPAPVRWAKLDLALNALEVDGGLTLDFDYRTERFAAVAVEVWIALFLGLLDEVSRRPETVIGSLASRPARGAGEEVTVSLRPIAIGGEDLLAAFRQQAEARPDAPAWSPGSAGGNSAGLSYAEMAERASQHALGLAPGDRVRLHLDGGAVGEGLAGLLACLELGCAWTPAVSARTLARQAALLRDRLDLGPGDLVLEVGEPSVDLALAALTAGACLLCVPEEEGWERELADATVLVVPVTAWRAAASAWSTAPLLRHVVLRGGALLEAELEPWRERPALRLHRVHEPAGLPIAAAFGEIELPAGTGGLRLVPAGEPLLDSLLLGPGGRPVPVGSFGLWSVRDGRLPEAEPISTGELARLLPDGRLEVAGPAAERVRLGGRPVDPRRVEAVVRLLAGEAAVAAVPGPTGEPELVAWVPVAVGAAGFAEDLRRRLAERLPPWQVPARFVRVERLPAAARRDLAALLALPGESESGFGGAAPADGLEARLVALWEEVLGRGGIGVHDGFLQLGGSSLQATQLLLRVQRETGREVGLGELLEARTVAGLARRLRSASRPAAAPIPRLPEAPDYALSHAQRRLWLFQQRDPASAAYHITVGAWLEGPLDGVALRRALEALVERHESLRTSLRERAGEPRQVVGSPLLPWEEIDLRGEVEPEGLVLSLARNQAARPFDLERGPLLRALLLRAGEGRNALLLTVHHIVADGWSVEVMVRDLSRLYRAFSAGVDAGLSSLRVQYRDYAAWQRSALEEAGEHREFWRRALLGDLLDGGPLPVVELPLDAPRPAVQSFHGAVVTSEIDGGVAAGLRRLAEERGASLFTVLLAASFAMLHRLTGQDDMVLGTPVAGRGHADLADQVGLYVNTLPLRLRVEGVEPFTALLERVRRAVLGALEHADYPIDLLLEETGGGRDWSRSALFDVLVALDEDRAEESWGAVRIEPLALEPEVSLFDLSFHFAGGAGGLRLSLVYNRDLFRRERIEALAEAARELLGDVAARPGAAVGELRLESAGQRRRGELAPIPELKL